MLVMFFLLPALFAGCSAPEKRLEKERLTLVYRPQAALESEIKELRLEHPIKISSEQVMNHLLSLHYEELSLMGKGKYVFTPDDVLEITPLITKALNRLKADNILYYEVDTPHGTTAGTIFRAKEKIHWRIEIIKGVSFSNSSFPGHRGSTWRLIPKSGQRYKQSKNLFGSQTQENWIVSGLDLPVKSKRSLRSRSPQNSSRNTSRAPERKRHESSPADQADLEKRLQFLKNLRDKELINDGEYERKRKELLDQFL